MSNLHTLRAAGTASLTTRRTSGRSAAAAAALIATLTVVACQAPAQETEVAAQEMEVVAQETEETAPAATVTMRNDLKFAPASITVQKGATVVWKNTSDVMHTVTAIPGKASNPANVRLPEGADPFGSGDMQPGGTFSHTFTVPGTYRYFCVPHEGAGMVGTVRVEG